MFYQIDQSLHFIAASYKIVFKGVASEGSVNKEIDKLPYQCLSIAAV